MNKTVLVALPMPLDKPLSYLRNEEALPVGALVLVPFRNKESIGIVWDKEAADNNQDLKLKSITQQIDLPPINTNTLEFLRQVARYNMIPLGNVIKSALSAFDRKIGVQLNHIKENTDCSSTPIELSSDQEVAVESIIATQNSHKVTLLDGVTGSGKTEVYLQAIIEIIKNDGQALVLLPEIVLTKHLMARFNDILKNYRILQWHSTLTKKKRHQNWLEIISGTAQIIIGARSALFLPYRNLKIIIVDEEHDTGFKQEEGMIYNARDMAVLKGNTENIPVILSSATPSIESIVNVQTGKYNHVILKHRFSGVTMPEIRIIDLNQDKMEKHQWLSNEARKEIINTVKNQKQALLFLNRRGYAPITMCRKCGTKSQCPQCHFLLVLHKKKQLLQCHYCGYTENPSDACKICGNIEPILSYGPGVERIEEELKTFIPEARVSLMTSDTISSTNIENVLHDITAHKIDIIIGTQIITKGLDFDKLHLVVIIEADSCQISGDIRSLERAYQLLHQVSGRAGRKDDRGLVLIQSHEPKNHLLRNLASGHRDEFIKDEIADRKEAFSPPFSRLVTIHIEGKNEGAIKSFAYDMQSRAPQMQNFQILGPSQAPIPLLRGKYRYRFIIKAAKNIKIQKIVRNWLKTNPPPSSLRIKIDVDPYNFL